MQRKEREKAGVWGDHYGILTGREESGQTLPVEGWRLESVSQPVCRPSGTRLCSTFLPGTYVPGLPMSPRRGWSSGVFHFLAVLGVATQTRPRPARPPSTSLRVGSRDACPSTRMTH